jgi:CheY-like chemotaxis protein
VATCDVFTAEDHHGVFLVQDLSAGGARLQGEAPIAEGRALKLILQLPNRQPMDVQARLVRGHAGEGTPPSFAVAFSDLSAEDEDTLHQGLMAELERQHARRFATVLVLDQAAEVRDVLEKDLRELGREAVGVATPLEAVGWLTTPGTSFDTLLVNLTSSAGPGIDVLDYVSAELPGVRRIALGDDSGAFRLDLALRAGRAQAVLKAPWNRADLIGVMGGAAVKASSP